MQRNVLPEPKRFLYIIGRGDSFGGSSMHVRDLAARLPLDGHRTKVVIGGEPDMEVPVRLRDRDVDFTCIKTMGREIDLKNDLRSIFAIRKIAREFRPDLISTHASKGGALGRVACLGLKCPVLYTPHCWSFVDGFALKEAYRLIEKGLAFVTTKIVAVSDDEREFGLSRKVGNPDKIITLHNGVHQVENSEGIETNHDRPVELVMVGRFEEQKDQKLLLRALSDLESQREWRMTFVGDGPSLREHQALARELDLDGMVTFAGYNANVSECLAKADLFVLATNWEGFPRSILEAMRSGLPVIASQVGGCHESVIDGVTGVIVPQGDRMKLRDALGDLIDNPAKRQAMGRAGRELYLREFTFEAMYEKYRRLYDELLYPGVVRSEAKTQTRESQPLQLAGHDVS